MKVEQTHLPGVLILEPRRFEDDRGYFFEAWQGQRYSDAGLKLPFVQDNVSHSVRGVLRGLHFQNPKAQGKLVSVLQGEVFDVAVDIQKDSPTFGSWFGILLSAKNGKQLWVPPGFAHGFYVTSETAVFSYKCTDYYSQDAEASLLWNDPDIAIDWPSGAKTLAPKDAAAPLLRDIPEEKLRFEVP